MVIGADGWQVYRLVGESAVSEAGKSGPKSNEPPAWFAGVDVGGTNIKLGFISSRGEIAGSGQIPTNQETGPAEAIERVKRELERLARELKTRHPEAQIKAAGLGTPGPLDVQSGMILDPVNLPGWRNFPVRDQLSEAIGLPVVYTNDANAAAWGEYWMGAGRAHGSIVLFTLGTGVGGGIVVGDEGWEGAHSLAAELGHVTVDTSPNARICSCGLPGHLEAYASATALVARCQSRLDQGGESTLARVAASGQLTARDIATAAVERDGLALELLRDTADWLARGVALAAHVVDPECFVIGGAMTFGGDGTMVGREFLARVRQKSAEMVFPALGQALKIVYATLGGEAGWIGAAGLARRHWQESPGGR